MRHRIMLLRHYGASTFDPARFQPVRNRWIKCHGGLWTSPADSTYGWREWSEDNDYGDTSCHFDIWFKGNVLTIDRARDLSKMRWVRDDSLLCVLDFEALVSKGVDAIHLTVRGQEETRFSQPLNLYGWDCETVLVMNAACLSAARPASRTALVSS